MKRALSSTLPELDELATQIGQFMVYWGFKEIHGRIWAHIYLSENPIDAGELIRRLGVSKALVSISLNDLLTYEVIEDAGKSESGTTVYKSNDDLMAVVTNILRRREQKMMADIALALGRLHDLSDQNKKNMKISAEKIQIMGDLVGAAGAVLDGFLSINTSDADLTSSLKKIATH